jgi:hypothetical protein
MKPLSRRSFLKTATVATGAAVAGVAPQVGKAAFEPAAEVIAPTAPVPREPLVVYVRDARRGELTVLAGTRETTVRDPGLVARLLTVARSAGALGRGGAS